MNLLTIPEYDFSTESDVEQKFIMPLLTHPSFLEVPSKTILTKKSLRVLSFVEKSSLPKGYIPDYIVFFNGYPILVIEAKAIMRDRRPLKRLFQPLGPQRQIKPARNGWFGTPRTAPRAGQPVSGHLYCIWD